MTRFIKLCAFPPMAAALVMWSLCASAAPLGAKADTYEPDDTRQRKRGGKTFHHDAVLATCAASLAPGLSPA